MVPEFNSIKQAGEIWYDVNSVAEDGEAASRPRESQLDSQWWLPVYVKGPRSFMHPVRHAMLNVNNCLKMLYNVNRDKMNMIDWKFATIVNENNVFKV